MSCFRSSGDVACGSRNRLDTPRDIPKKTGPLAKIETRRERANARAHAHFTSSSFCDAIACPWAAMMTVPFAYAEGACREDVAGTSTLQTVSKVFG